MRLLERDVATAILRCGGGVGRGGETTQAVYVY